MSNEVYANGREVSCKAASGKATASFPDVCFTPPQTPATPPGVPIPYPNTGMASDCTEGSKTVQVSGQEVMLKNQSYFKKSSGDEAGSTPKKGLMSSKNMGKVYFTMWSMDVKFEGQNVVRHLDMTTHNHGSPPNTGPWMYADASAYGDPKACEKEQKRIDKACAGYKPKGNKDPCALSKPSQNQSLPKQHAESMAKGDKIGADKCLAARRCALQPWNPDKDDKAKGHTCCTPQTGHHLVEASAVAVKRGGTLLQGIKNYTPDEAPCICAEGPGQHVGTHGLLHSCQRQAYAKIKKETPLKVKGGGTIMFKATTYGAARDSSVKCVKKVFKESGCNEKCLKAQLDEYHKKRCKMEDDTPIKAVEEGNIPWDGAKKEIAARLQRIAAARAGSTGAGW
jgi:hypothetical protein